MLSELKDDVIDPLQRLPLPPILSMVNTPGVKLPIAGCQLIIRGLNE